MSSKTYNPKSIIFSWNEVNERNFKMLFTHFAKDHIRVVKKFIGKDQLEKQKPSIRDAVCEKIRKVQDILSDGLDVGGIKKHVIKVNLVYHNEYEYCFQNIENRAIYPFYLPTVSNEL